MVIILIKGQKVELKWNKLTREWYENKGYIFTKTSDSFIVNAEDLSPGAHYKVKVQCDYCGEICDVAWRDYYRYKNKYDLYSCKHCRQKKTCASTLEQRQESLYNRAKMFCDENNYELLCSKEDIVNSWTRVKYICPLHGIHEVTIYNLITGHRCIDCGYIASTNYHRLSPDFVENEFKKYNGILLNKEEYVSWATKNLKVICPSCGDIFLTSYNSFVKHCGQRCPSCSNIESKGEYSVRTYLEENDINYRSQFRFDDCKNIHTLSFDFYLPDMNIAIEFDGIQHFEPIKRGNMSQEEIDEMYQNIKLRDEIKNKYCQDNNIKLIRIPYWEIDNVATILSNSI